MAVRTLGKAYLKHATLDAPSGPNVRKGVRLHKAEISKARGLTCFSLSDNKWKEVSDDIFSLNSSNSFAATVVGRKKVMINQKQNNGTVVPLASTSPKTDNFILFLGEFHFDDFRKNEAFQMF